jgi:hypothetical protein
MPRGRPDAAVDACNRGARHLGALGASFEDRPSSGPVSAYCLGLCRRTAEWHSRGAGNAPDRGRLASPIRDQAVGRASR